MGITPPPPNYDLHSEYALPYLNTPQNYDSIWRKGGEFMSEVRLTKDADVMICVLYKEYLQRRKSGASRFDARFFGGAENIQANLMPKWKLDDIDTICQELHRAKLLSCFFADNITAESALTDEGIIYMENRFKDGLTALFQYLEKLRSILPF